MFSTSHMPLSEEIFFFQSNYEAKKTIFMSFMKQISNVSEVAATNRANQAWLGTSTLAFPAQPYWTFLYVRLSTKGAPVAHGYSSCSSKYQKIVPTCTLAY